MRKVLITAHELGCAEQISLIVPPVVRNEPDDRYLAINPLNRIPVLVTDEDGAIYDSSVICDYLDSRFHGRLSPLDGAPRWSVQRRQTLADGLMEICLLWVDERRRPPALISPQHLHAYETKARRTLAYLESVAGEMQSSSLDLGHIAIGCALSYLDFRFSDFDWRADCAGLARWQIEFEARPSAQAAVLKD